MKNITEILKAYGLEVPEDRKKDFDREFLENYKTVTDYEKQTDKLEEATKLSKAHEDTIKELNGKLDEFKDADVSGMKQQIADYETEKKRIRDEYEAKISDRDFQEMLKDSITAAKGRNAKAIAALLDVETLKASKNQKEDIAAALKTLSEAEDSKMLFGSAQSTSESYIDTIGFFGTGGQPETATAQMRAIMGLPEITK